MTKMKSWTVFTLLALLVFSIVVLPLTAWYNLKHYSVYYANRIPTNKNSHPEIVFIVDNISSILLPTDKKITYNIYNKQIKFLLEDKDKSTEKYIILEPDWTIENLDGYMISLENNTSYHWDYYGNFLYHYSYIDDKKTSDENAYHDAKQILLETTYPIVSIQPEPKLNLQWLFNWVHRDRFNQD